MVKNKTLIYLYVSKHTQETKSKTLLKVVLASTMLISVPPVSAMDYSEAGMEEVKKKKPTSRSSRFSIFQ